MKKSVIGVILLGLLVTLMFFPLYGVVAIPENALRTRRNVGLVLYAITINSYYDSDDSRLKYSHWRGNSKKPTLFNGLHDSKSLFSKDIFSNRVCDRMSSKHGFDLWVNEIDKYDSFRNASLLVLKQLHDLGGRLEILDRRKKQIATKYNDPKAANRLNKDISYLSELGWRLIKATRSFFKSAKASMINLEIASARQEALKGLKTFNRNIEKIKEMQLKSVDQSIELLIKALKDLEKAANQ